MFGSKKKTDAVTDRTPQVVLRYYEADGALKANANKAWLLAFLTKSAASARAANILSRISPAATGSARLFVTKLFSPEKCATSPLRARTS